MDQTRIDNFVAYARTFLCGKPENDANIQLKIDHTMRVLREAEAIAAAENLSPELTEECLNAALYHDISRFEQFAEYQTFRDSESFDHGDRSAEIVENNTDLLTVGGDSAAAGRIIQAIRFHNKVALPPEISGSDAFVARCVRDADKLDILELFIGFLENPVNEAVVFSLDLSAPISPEIMGSMLRGEVPLHSQMRSANDFTVAKLMWAQDLGFRHTRQEFRRRRYLERIVKFLPDIPEITRFRQNAEMWLDK